MADDVAEMLARLRTAYGDRLARVGVVFALGAWSRVRIAGVERVVRLHVWPETGVDNFEWTVRRRRWVGGVVFPLTVRVAEAQISDVLERYEAGEIPPFPDPRGCP